MQTLKSYIFNGVHPNRHYHLAKPDEDCFYCGRITNQKVRNRVAVERRVVRQFLKDTIAAGFFLVVDEWISEFGFDDEEVQPTQDIMQLQNQIFNLDEAHVMLFNEGENPAEDVSQGWVYFVFGNSGWDVISDYTTNIEDELHLLTKSNKIADKMEKIRG